MDSLTPEWQEALDDYTPYLIGRAKPRTVDLRLRTVRMFAAAHPTGPGSVALPDLHRFVAREGWLPNTRRVHQHGLLLFFGWAAGPGKVVTPNPTLGWELIKAPRTIPKPARRADVARALREADPQSRFMVELASDAGLTAGEIASLHTRDLDQQDGHWELKVRGQRDVDQVVYLNPRLAGKIRDSAEGFVFPGKINGHKSPAYVSRLISSVLPEGVTARSLQQAHAAARRGRRNAPSWREAGQFRASGYTRLINAPDLEESETLQLELHEIERTLTTKPAASIAACKTLLETLFLTVLAGLEIEEPENDDLPPLWNKVAVALEINAKSVPTDDDASGSIKSILQALTTSVQKLAELRNRIGDHHGKRYVSPAEPRHSFLAFNATVAVAEFVWETWRLHLSEREYPADH